MQSQYTTANIARFWAKVNKDGPTPSHAPHLGPCWIWTAQRLKRGYGVIRVNTRSTLAHRFSYVLQHGSIPNGLFVLHRCDNPPCIRPDHLFTGTNTQNMQDAATKGRVPHGDEHWSHRTPERAARGDRNGASTSPERVQRGSTHHQARLTDDDVRDIRRLYAEGGHTLIAIGRRYGISMQHVSDIVRRKRWAHVSETHPTQPPLHPADQGD